MRYLTRVVETHTPVKMQRAGNGSCGGERRRRVCARAPPRRFYTHDNALRFVPGRSQRSLRVGNAHDNRCLPTCVVVVGDFTFVSKMFLYLSEE